MTKLIYKTLNPNTWTDLVELFGDRGACGGCWCMTMRLSSKAYENNKGDSNKRKFHNLVKENQPLGILAYDRDKPIGWCSVSPRETLTRIENSRYFKRIDDQPVWSIACFFVLKEFRHEGMSLNLIREASKYAFDQGANIIEAYPIIPKKDRVPEVFAWVGFSSTFKKAGFKVVRQPSETRVMMRLTK
ncbi:GNAT family N-acetyltransferase [Fulvivirgaceae bacterium BMA10]|uniref:GNAT family N-acetyltransferase n=1 Tax=Splendidivirga corallicola TaxID=3051826 RepID=A0ABT8KX40_9BACT|nr:GNAT family N-acetyltransferase [Fulvivirgaceae bacterium BMA10]